MRMLCFIAAIITVAVLLPPGEWVQNLLRQLGMSEDAAIESRMVARRVKQAQKKIEGQVTGESLAESSEQWLERNYQEWVGSWTSKGSQPEETSAEGEERGVGSPIAFSRTPGDNSRKLWPREAHWESRNP